MYLAILGKILPIFQQKIRHFLPIPARNPRKTLPDGHCLFCRLDGEKACSCQKFSPTIKAFCNPLVISRRQIRQSRSGVSELRDAVSNVRNAAFERRNPAPACEMSKFPTFWRSKTNKKNPAMKIHSGIYN